ncbi:MAG: hypothetical protein KAQ79_22945 [Cyclobacteriaceae bacterium]|nr:hypothetical protein [Cyclobacteriaceae bacterium]
MKIFITTILALFLLQSCIHTDSTEHNCIIGVKIYDHQGSFKPLFEEWKEIGINAAFVSKELLANKDFREGAVKNQIKTFVILPIFFDDEALNKNPELYAIKSNGEKAVDEWVKFVCPSNNSFRKDKIASIMKLVKAYHPDGLSIDFIRHFVFWEKVFPKTQLSILPNTCFNPSCIEGFQKHSEIEVPDSLTKTEDISSWILENHLSEWTKWKCVLITSMVEEIVNHAKEIKPEILINAHIVPWRQADFDNGIRIIAGQDVKAISNHTDFLSPMTYSHMVKQDADWVHAVVEELYKQTQENILPSIQVKEAYLTDSLSSHEFELNLESALMAPSKGVVFWSWEHFDQDPWKKEVIRKKVL